MIEISVIETAQLRDALTHVCDDITHASCISLKFVCLLFKWFEYKIRKVRLDSR